MITLTIILLAIPVILVIALFTRKGITAEASVVIDKPQQVVFNYLVQLKSQERFNTWLMTDPHIKISYSGTDGEQGCTQAWESKNPKDGKASQKIISIAAPKKIEIELSFEKPIKSQAHYQFQLQPISEKETKVLWSYTGNTSPYYVLRVSHILLRLKKRVTDYMKTSLDSLKKIVEAA